MFSDPVAAAWKGVIKRGLIGNSAWGRSLLAKKAAKHRTPKPPKPNLCTQCQAIIGLPIGVNAVVIQDRLAAYEQRKQTTQAE